MATLGRTIPALPVRDAAAAAASYRDRLAFRVLHQDEALVVLERDGAQVYLWEADDDSWRERPGHEELSARDVLHPVSRDAVSETDFGSREFATLDADGSLISFFERVSS